MAGRPTNPIDSTPAFVIQCTFDDGLRKVADNIGNDPSRVAVVRRAGASTDIWNIELGTILVSVAPGHAQRAGVKRMHNSLTRSYGKRLVVGQAMGLPITDGPVTIVATDEQEAAEIRESKLLERFHFSGISQSGMRLGGGSGDTPLSNGIVSIVHGPVTVHPILKQPIGPMTDLVLAVAPTSNQGALLPGGNRTPFTFAPFEAYGTTPLARASIRRYRDAMQKMQGASGASGAAKFSPFTVESSKKMGTDLYHDDIKDGALFSLGAMAMSLVFVDTLIRDGILTYNSASSFSSPPSVSSSNEANARAWRKEAPENLGLADDARSFQQTQQDLFIKLVDRMLLGETVKDADVANLRYRVMAKSALKYQAGAIQDITNRYRRIVARSIQMEGGSSNNNAMTRDMDIIIF